MRIVIDMQGAQTESRFRGIGRYTMSFSQAVVRNRGKNEIILVLSGNFPETIEPIRAAFEGILPQKNIRIWHAPGPVYEKVDGNSARREIAEIMREDFLRSLEPDIIHISSLNEGFLDNAVTSIGRFDNSTPVSVMVYDFIPLIYPGAYLNSNNRYSNYYKRKINFFNKASIYFSISKSSLEEGVRCLKKDKTLFTNISASIDPKFTPQIFKKSDTRILQNKFGLSRPFVLYVGGSDERKNLAKLIEAYAMLSKELRVTYQLLFAGKIPEGDVKNFRKIAQDAGLKNDELLFTDFINDDDLIHLYNLCYLFVFPSYHEGFGLPPLEAMSCGAPVIAANTSSLPEIIGLPEALFDPFDVKSINSKLSQALKDVKFRKRLQKHGLGQVKIFSWDKTATKAIKAWQGVALSKQEKNKSQALAEYSFDKFFNIINPYLKTFDDSELSFLASHIAQNKTAGIERQLLVDISELYHRDSATGVQRVVRSYLIQLLLNPPDGFMVRPVYATLTEGYRYAFSYTSKILHESNFLTDDLPMRWQRGDIFFGLDMQHHVQIANTNIFSQLRQEGVVVKFIVYDLLPIELPDLFKDDKAKELHEVWLKLIIMQDEAICISKTTADALKDWIKLSSIKMATHFCVSWLHMGADIDSSIPSSGLPANAIKALSNIKARPSFLCVSTLEPRKAQIQIIDALENLWMNGEDVNLVLVGCKGWKTDALVDRIIKHAEYGKRLFWFEGISDEYLDLIYQSCTCLVAASINEGFGLSLIEAARHNLPIIARDIPIFREVAGEHAFYFKGDNGKELAENLSRWLQFWRNGKHPASKGMKWLTWQQSAKQLKTILINQNYPCNQLLVDISELIQRDAKSGIQRVVRNVLKEWLENPPKGYKVEPVYASTTEPYRYARLFTAKFTGNSNDLLADDPIEFSPGDIFFVLDMQPQVQVAKADFYQFLRQQGVIVKFLVYDILCILQPEYFPPNSAENFTKWLEVVAESDGAICISETVENELREWMDNKKWKRLRRHSIECNYSGTDINSTVLSTNFELPPLLKTIKQDFNFLIVGTIEPRKGHNQVLEAFEYLWHANIDVNLIIVGKQGWMVEELVDRLHKHPELNRRLYWFEGISDEYLEKIYALSTCLIAASYGEGFGLPLIEAARNGLPIIARDIPVFREVAGKNAYYFSGLKPKDFERGLIGWMKLYENQQHPKSNDMPYLTWKQSAELLVQKLGL
jgi:glycosyltransferase involved in cell wall biosynthesis